MGNLGRRSELLQSERSLTAGSAGYPERRRSAEQEILRSARMAACRSDFDDRSSGKSIPGTERDRRSVRYSFLLISRPALRVFFSPAKLPDALRLSGLHVSCNILNLQVFVGRIRRSRRIRHDKAHIDICLSPALRGFFRQKQGDSDEKSVIYLAKLCFIVYPCQTARHKAAECISPF